MKDNQHIQLSLRIESLPTVPAPYDFIGPAEKLLSKFKKELLQSAQEKHVDTTLPFKVGIFFNQPPPSAMYYVVSIKMNKTIQVSEKDLWDVKEGKKDFTQEQIVTLQEILGRH